MAYYPGSDLNPYYKGGTVDTDSFASTGGLYSRNPQPKEGKGSKKDLPEGVGAIFGGPSGGVDQSSIMDLLRAGELKGEELTGLKAGEVGKKRGEIRGRYEDILNQPSRGASRVASARNAELKRLKAAQQKSGVSGPMASLQQSQMSQDYARSIGDVRQQEYMDALDKIERQYRGAGGDIMKSSGQYGAIGVGGKPAPTIEADSGVTYLCTELNKRGLISTKELHFIHILLFIGTLLNPADTYFYLRNGMKLVLRMNETMPSVGWTNLKNRLFVPCLDLMKSFRFSKAINHYRVETEHLFRLYGFYEEVEAHNNKWSFNKLIKSIKIMWRVTNG